MLSLKHLGISLAVAAAVAAGVAAQTIGQPEEYTAVAIQNNNLGRGANRVIIRVTRWSSEAERTRLAAALQKGTDTLLDELQDQKSVGTIRTPDSLGYDLHYAQQTPAEDGGRSIVIATDRPIGFSGPPVNGDLHRLLACPIFRTQRHRICGEPLRPLVGLRERERSHEQHKSSDRREMTAIHW